MSLIKRINEFPFTILKELIKNNVKVRYLLTVQIINQTYDKHGKACRDLICERVMKGIGTMLIDETNVQVKWYPIGTSNLYYYSCAGVIDEMVTQYTRIVLESAYQELVNKGGITDNFGLLFFICKPLKYSNPIFEKMITGKKEK